MSIDSLAIPTISGTQWRSRPALQALDEAVARCGINPTHHHYCAQRCRVTGTERWDDLLSPPSNEPSPPAFLDGRGQLTRNARGGVSFAALLQGREQIAGLETVTIVRSSLRHQLTRSGRRELDQAVLAGEILTAPAGSSETRFLAAIARQGRPTLIQTSELAPVPGFRIVVAEGKPGAWRKAATTPPRRLKQPIPPPPAKAPGRMAALVLDAASAASTTPAELAHSIDITPRSLELVLHHHIDPAFDDLERAHLATGHVATVTIGLVRVSRTLRANPVGLISQLPAATFSEQSIYALTTIDRIVNAAGRRLKVHLAEATVQTTHRPPP